MRTVATAPFAAPPGEEEVVRVVCASRSLIDSAVFTHMERIRKAALAHNVPGAVHAVLMHQSGWFIYWAEGPLVGVRATLLICSLGILSSSLWLIFSPIRRLQGHGP